MSKARLRFLLPLAFLPAIAATAGCTFSTSSPPPQTDSSTSYATSQFKASFSAQDYGDGSGIHVYAALLGPDGNFVQLSGTDSFTARSNGVEMPMTVEPNEDPGTVHYTCIFPSASVETSITIELNRASGEQATSSTTVVAPPFTILTPAPAQLTAGQKVTIQVSPAPTAAIPGSGDSWQLTASGSCITDFTASSVDSLLDAQGNVVFDTSTLQKDSGQQATSCPIQVFVRHEHFGPDDPAFAGPVYDGNGGYTNAPTGATWDVEGVQARVWNTSVTFAATKEQN